MDNAHQLRVVDRIFASLFQQRYQTQLKGGADEPFYRASTDDQSAHQLYYRGDYLASALHEVAHWCIAGEQRRALDDFGYWYQPGERSADLQRQFEAVEVAPQALEWLFSRAVGVRFQLSVDNFALDNQPPREFACAVVARLHRWLTVTLLPARAEEFARALAGQLQPHLLPELLFDPTHYRLDLLLGEERAA